MIRIGDFARLSQVSIVTLRHYDEFGLLKPVAVDPATGYRYYSVGQLPRLNRILSLKDLGFSLKPLLVANPNIRVTAKVPSNHEALLRKEYRAVAQAISETAAESERQETL